MYSEDFDRNEKMVQVWTKMFKQNLTSPPSSSSSSNSSNNSEGFLSKTARRGFRLAEFALEASLATASTTAQFLWNATSPPEYDINNLQDEEEVEEEVEAPTSSVDVPHIARDRSRSRDSSSDLGDRLLQRGASRSNRSITPSSGNQQVALKQLLEKNNILMKVI